MDGSSDTEGYWSPASPKLCGKQIPSPVEIIDASRAKVTFSSQEAVQGSGFLVSLV